MTRHSTVVRHAINLFNLRQGDSLPRLFEDMMTTSQAMKMERSVHRLDGTIRHRGHVATIRDIRRTRSKDRMTGEEFSVVQFKLLRRY